MSHLASTAMTPASLEALLSEESTLLWEIQWGPEVNENGCQTGEWRQDCWGQSAQAKIMSWQTPVPHSWNIHNFCQKANICTLNPEGKINKLLMIVPEDRMQRHKKVTPSLSCYKYLLLPKLSSRATSSHLHIPSSSSFMTHLLI